MEFKFLYLLPASISNLYCVFESRLFLTQNFKHHLAVYVLSGISPQFTSNLIKFFLCWKTFIAFYCSQNKIQNLHQFLKILICSFSPHSFLLFSLTSSLSSSTAFIKVVPSLRVLIFPFHLEHITPLTAQWVSSKLKYFMNWLLSHELPSPCQWSVTEQSCCHNIFLTYFSFCM